MDCFNGSYYKVLEVRRGQKLKYRPSIKYILCQIKRSAFIALFAPDNSVIICETQNISAI